MAKANHTRTVLQHVPSVLWILKQKWLRKRESCGLRAELRFLTSSHQRNFTLFITAMLTHTYPFFLM